MGLPEERAELAVRIGALQRLEAGMVAGPAAETPGLAGAMEPADDVAVGIEKACGRHGGDREPFLPPRLMQQRRRRKRRWRAGVFRCENRGDKSGHGKVTIAAPAEQGSDPPAQHRRNPVSGALRPAPYVTGPI